MQILSTGEQGPTYWPIAIPFIGLTIILALGLLESTWQPWRLLQKSPSIQKFLHESYLKKKIALSDHFTRPLGTAILLSFLLHIPDECFKNVHNIKKDQNSLPQNNLWALISYTNISVHTVAISFIRRVNIFMIEFLEGIVFLSGQWYSYLLIMVMSDLGFKTMVGPPLACFITFIHWTPQRPTLANLNSASRYPILHPVTFSNIGTQCLTNK